MPEIREEESRTAAMLGADAVEKLHRAHVAVFGVGGVGGYVCEALARAGVGALSLFDRDTVSLSNINRQIIALHSTVGRPKTDVMKERILDINPDCLVTCHTVFYLPENADDFPLDGYDYLVDAVDTVSAKVELAVRAAAAGIPIISAMGAGNKSDPSRFRVTDLAKTSGCPLARVMRRELRGRGIEHLKVVFSDEIPVPSASRAPASLPFVPGAAGLVMAGAVISDLRKKEGAAALSADRKSTVER